MALRLGVAVLAVLIAFAPACSGGSGSDDIEITLRSVAGGPVQDSELDQSVAILQERLDRAGMEATVTRADDSRHVVIRLDGSSSTAAQRVVDLATRTGLLEFYDLEANLVRPSIDEDGFPVATASLYDLLAGRQPRVGEEDEVDSWYLFDAAKKLAGGPAPTKRLLLSGGALLDGWRILGVPAKTAVLECGIGEVVCPGEGVERPRHDSYYLIRYDPPTTPELDAGDLDPEGMRQDVDTLTGEPIVVVRFTSAGAARFEEVTKREAQRGKRIELLTGIDPSTTFQHFAIVLDREIKSWPSIDWQQYPNGIGGTNGAQIAGIGELGEAKNLALLLQTGPLPVRFEVVPPASGS